MTTSLANAINAALPHSAQHFRESSTLQQAPSNADGTLDGSVAQVTRFLRELIGMTGQEIEAVPVLELQLGEILTRTTIQTADRSYLLITAIMPKCRRSHYLLQASAETSLEDEEDIHYLWHADEGRHIGVRRIPIAKLPDERSVMGAILTMADETGAWFSERRGSKSPT